MKKINEEKRTLKEFKDDLKRAIEGIQEIYTSRMNDSQMKKKENESYHIHLGKLTESVNKYEEQVKAEVAEKSHLADPATLTFDQSFIHTLIADCAARLSIISKSREGDPKWDVREKISTALNAYGELQSLKQKKHSYDRQLETMGIIVKKFQKKQKEALESFRSSLSKVINEVYEYMNPGENAENFKFTSTTEKNDDDKITGIRMEHDFLGKPGCPPHKFLSESHVNCLGIAWFLASLDKSDARNRFFLLDDVISSFDVAHRSRFAKLLSTDKYNDYQIILLTHEKAFFEEVKMRIAEAGRKWKVKKVKYSEEEGTHIDGDDPSLRERIEEKIKREDDNEGLGNQIRRYLEGILNKIGQNFPIQVSFTSNERNESRRIPDLLEDFLKTLENKAPEIYTQKKGSLRELKTLNHSVGNKGSHHRSDSALSFKETKLYWKEVDAFEKFFSCPKCHSPVKLNLYDRNTGKMHCKGCKHEFSWKREVGAATC